LNETLDWIRARGLKRRTEKKSIERGGVIVPRMGKVLWEGHCKVKGGGDRKKRKRTSRRDKKKKKKSGGNHPGVWGRV